MEEDARGYYYGGYRLSNLTKQVNSDIPNLENWYALAICILTDKDPYTALLAMGIETKKNKTPKVVMERGHAGETMYVLHCFGLSWGKIGKLFDRRASHVASCATSWKSKTLEKIGVERGDAEMLAKRAQRKLKTKEYRKAHRETINRKKREYAAEKRKKEALN